ncbi:caspase domain-containing protein [Streptomyces sp. R28]|uniref:Caspase domain-containing protein n=1 Tax=Streptomyces sp. R28 TaxID=3238628 RepID=A0AB39Q912_9ACTN
MAEPRYRALLIGNATFPRDPHGLTDLKGPLVDVEVLRQVLTDREVGLFDPKDVEKLPDRGVQELRERIDDFYSSADREDVLLLYYSGHGELDIQGTLYLCAKDTKSGSLRSTALSALEINNMINSSAAATTIIVLDCCYSGAFKGGRSAPLAAGKGRYVLTSNRSTQVTPDAREGEASPFTRLLVRGLRHAPAERYLTVTELYKHVHIWMTASGPTVTPQLRIAGEGTVIISRRNPGIEVGKPAAAGSSTEARAALLTRMAVAMRAVVAKPEVLTRALSTQRVLRSPQSSAKASAHTRPLPNPTGPFAAEWTGEEQLSTYTARPDLFSVWLWAMGMSFASAGLIYFPYRTGLIRAGSETDTPWFLLLLFGILIAILALLVIVAAITDAFGVVRHAGMLKKKAGWALHVSPQGIVTHSVAGRHEFAWDRIQRVVIEEIQGSPPLRYTGVHIDLAPGAARSTMMRPAGWIYPQPGTVRLRPSGRIPICVLGPMTERQRTDLMEALASYGGQRWVPSVSFASLPVDP